MTVVSIRVVVGVTVVCVGFSVVVTLVVVVVSSVVVLLLVTDVVVVDVVVVVVYVDVIVLLSVVTSVSFIPSLLEPADIGCVAKHSKRIPINVAITANT